MEWKLDWGDAAGSETYAPRQCLPDQLGLVRSEPIRIQEGPTLSAGSRTPGRH